MIKGIYRDMIKIGSQIQDRGFCSNRIVQSCDYLVASLMKNPSQLSGITFLAVGEGDTYWDGRTVTPSVQDGRLKKEIARYRISDVICFIDTTETESDIPTSRLKISFEIKSEHFKPAALTQLREFALFGGDADLNAYSGYMINHVIHPRIDITPEVTLTRTIILRFSNTTSESRLETTTLHYLPIRLLDGIGSVYEKEFLKYGIATIADLIKLHPGEFDGKIPIATFNELWAKAALISKMQPDARVLKPFMDIEIITFLNSTIHSLEQIAASRVTVEQIRHQRRELSALEISFDTSSLKNMRVRDLLKK